MIRVQTFPCALAKAEADALNRESGRHYTTTMVWHYRISRRTGHWLSEGAAQKLEDSLGGATILHAHSRDAAQQGCYDACTVARAQQKLGLKTRYPHRRKFYRATTWKNTGIRIRDGVMLLARSRGWEPVRVAFPPNLQGLAASACKQVQLVWDQAGRHYHWHVTLDDTCAPAPVPGNAVVAVDLGEIHPAALTDGQKAVVITARRLRSTHQYTAKRRSQIQAKPSGKQKGSKRWRRLQQRKHRFLAPQKKRARDIEHKVSRAAGADALERKAGTLAIGDVRDLADGKRMGAKSQQKISLWSHGARERPALHHLQGASQRDHGRADRRA